MSLYYKQKKKKNFPISNFISESCKIILFFNNILFCLLRIDIGF